MTYYLSGTFFLTHASLSFVWDFGLKNIFNIKKINLKKKILI